VVDRWALAFLFQAAPSISIDPAWAVTAITSILSVLGTVIAVLYRGQVGALKEQITAQSNEIRYQRMLINRLAGVQEGAMDVNRTAIEVARRQLGADI
jgi:hypothetical protein